MRGLLSVLYFVHMCTFEQKKTSATLPRRVWTVDTYGQCGHPCALTTTNMIIQKKNVFFPSSAFLSPFPFSLVNHIIAMKRVAWKCGACDARQYGRRQIKNKSWIFMMTTYVPSNSLRWYFSSIENCLSGSRRSRLDFFVESFFPNSGILEFFKLLIQNKICVN